MATRRISRPVDNGDASNERTIRVKITGDTVNDAAAVGVDAISDAQATKIANAILTFKGEGGKDILGLLSSIVTSMHDSEKLYGELRKRILSKAADSGVEFDADGKVKDASKMAELIKDDEFMAALKIVSDKQEADKKQKEEANRKEQLSTIKSIEDKLGDVSKNISGMSKSINASLKTMNETTAAIMSGNISGTINGTKSLIDSLEGSLKDMVESGRGGALAKGLGSVLPYASTALGIAGDVYSSLEAANTLVDNVSGYRRQALNATGYGDIGAIASVAGSAWGDKVLALTSNMTDEDVKAMNKSLMAAGATYGDEAFSTGRNWAMQAADEYGISASKAAQLYADNVISGAMSAQQLSIELGNLQETVRETGKSMTEVMSEWEKQQKEMEKNLAWSGNDAAIASSLYAMTGDQDLAATAAGRISAVQQSMGDKKFRAAVKSYAEQYDVGEMEAMVAVAEQNFDSTSGMKSLEKYKLMDGLTIGQYLDMGDEESLRAAINDTVLYSAKKGNELIKLFANATGKTVEIDELADEMAKYFFENDVYGDVINASLAYSRQTGRSTADDSGNSELSYNYLDRMWGGLRQQGYGIARLWNKDLDKNLDALGTGFWDATFGNAEVEINTDEAYKYYWDNITKDTFDIKEFNRLNTVGDADRQAAIEAARERSGGSNIKITVEPSPMFTVIAEEGQRRLDRDRGVLQFES